MKRLLIVPLLAGIAAVCQARPIRLWPYDSLIAAADFAAVVEVTDIEPSVQPWIAPQSNDGFAAEEATLRPLWIIKGDPAASTLRLVLWHYVAPAAIMDGPQFARLDRGENRQYLVFLKKTASGYVPVSGDYDAAQSIFGVAPEVWYHDRPRQAAGHPGP